MEKGLKRAREISLKKDRLEEEVVEFHERIRQGFLNLAEKEERCQVFQADQDREQLHSRIIKKVRERLL